MNNTLSVVAGDWKYIEPSQGPAMNKGTNTELGNSPDIQLYNIRINPSETKNMASTNPAIVNKLNKILEQERNKE